MQFEFELTEDDWVAVGNDFRRMTPGQFSPVAYLMMAISGGGIALLILVFVLKDYIYDVPDLGELIGTFASGVGLYSCFICLWVWWNYRDSAIRRRTRRQSDLRHGVDPLGPRIVTIDENRIAETTPDHNGSIAWSRVERVTHAPKHLFVYLTSLPECVICFIIPRRAFATESEFEDFCRTAHEYWETARRPKPSA